MILTILSQAAPTEPPPAGWTAGVGYVVQHAEQSPNVVFPLLAIAGPVLVGCAFIWASVKYGLPFIKEELAEFRKHTAELLKRTADDAADDIAAARALSAAQHESIVQRVEGRIERQTGEIAKLSERSEKHGEVLRSIAQKLAVGLLIVLALAGAVAAGRVRARELAAGECTNNPCASGTHCCGQDKCCRDTGTAGVPHTSLFADRRTDAVRDN